MSKTIGLDISRSCTSICVIAQDRASFHAIVNAKAFTSKVEYTEDYLYENWDQLAVMEECDDVNMHIVEASTSRKKDINEQHRASLRHAVIYSDLISDIVKRIANKKSSIWIEHYSYGSPNNNLIDMVQTGTLIKDKISRKIFDGRIENINVVPGPTVKQFAGKGNYDKYEMLKAFLELENKKRSDLFNQIEDNMGRLIKVSKGDKNPKVLTPVDDIIDSYFVASYGENEENKDTD